MVSELPDHLQDLRRHLESQQTRGALVHVSSTEDADGECLEWHNGARKVPHELANVVDLNDGEDHTRSDYCLYINRKEYDVHDGKRLCTGSGASFQVKIMLKPPPQPGEGSPGDSEDDEGHHGTPSAGNVVLLDDVAPEEDEVTFIDFSQAERAIQMCLQGLCVPMFLA